MMPHNPDRSRLRKLALIFALILVLLLMSILAPTDPNPPTPTPWISGEMITPSPTPTATPAWWQDFPTPIPLYPTPTGEPNVTPTQP